MRKTKSFAIAIACLLALGACTDNDLTTTTVDRGAVTTVADSTGATADVAATIAEVQSEVTDLSNEIQNSAAAAELQESWNTLQTAVLAAVASVADDGTMDGTQIQGAIDDFQTDLDALGADAEPTVVEAWDTLRDNLESMMP
jgi:hypothetical protein